MTPIGFHRRKGLKNGGLEWTAPLNKSGVVVVLAAGGSCCFSSKPSFVYYAVSPENWTLQPACVKSFTIEVPLKLILE